MNIPKLMDVPPPPTHRGPGAGTAQKLPVIPRETVHQHPTYRSHSRTLIDPQSSPPYSVLSKMTWKLSRYLSAGEWVKIEVYPYSGISSSKKKMTYFDIHNDMGEFQKYYVLQSKPDTKGYSPCMIPFLWNSKPSNTILLSEKVDQWLYESRGEDWPQRTLKDPRGEKYSVSIWWWLYECWYLSNSSNHTFKMGTFYCM